FPEGMKAKDSSAVHNAAIPKRPPPFVLNCFTKLYPFLTKLFIINPPFLTVSIPFPLLVPYYDPLRNNILLRGYGDYVYSIMDLTCIDGNRADSVVCVCIYSSTQHVRHYDIHYPLPTRVHVS